jgi:hypothetical protein
MPTSPLAEFEESKAQSPTDLEIRHTPISSDLGSDESEIED